MSIKILTKSGEEITAVDDARAYNFDAGNKSGIVKGALNEGKLFLVSSNVIGLDSCELRISGHRIVIDSAESITMANRPSVATRYSMIAEVVVSDASVPSFRLFIQPAKTELIQQNLYKTLNGNGTYQLRIGNFTLGTDGLISDIVRTADVISGATNGVGDIEFNVTTETIAGDLEPEVNVDFNEETKKYDMHFALPLSSGTSVIENGEVVKRFNADLKVDKEEGKGLSTNDFTTAEKNKLAGLSNYNDASLSNRVSTNAENISKLQNNKQDKLTAGNGINIANGVISSLLKGAICLQTNFDQAISGENKKIEFRKQVSSVGTGVLFSGNSFAITSDDVTCIKFTISCSFYNMSGPAYYQLKPKKNNVDTGDSLWFFYDSGHSGGFTNTIMFNCKKSDVFEFFGQTVSNTTGYLNGNTYITVEVF